MSFFADYYKNTIKNDKGFKLVLGGTGLGKTRGIIDTIKEHPSENKRFFYLANRLQLLNEFTADLQKEKIDYCFQRRDDEIIREITRTEIETLLDMVVIQKYSYQISNGNLSKVDAIGRIVKFIKENDTLYSTKDGSEILREKTRQVFSFFKKILKKSSDKDYAILIKNKIIKKLFPFIDFQNNPKEKRVFIVSLQKTFYGFFDGRKIINLHSLKSNDRNKEQNIIFLDEFDFLENDLLSQISKDTNIEQPFSFVELFYNTLTKYKLPRSNFLKHYPEVRKELEKIVKEIESLSLKYELPFPSINHFLCTDDSLKDTAIFQTRYSICNYRIYLNHKRKNNNNEKIDAFYLERATKDNKANAFTLLNIVNQTTAKIIRIIKELEFEKPEVCKALVEHCFGTSDKYKRILRLIHQRPSRRKLVPTNISKMYYNGFGLYEVHNFEYPTDMDEVELKYYSLFNTPESILLSLTNNNLVFGLSATVGIERYIKNFDLNWLKYELGDLYHEITSNDIKIIESANNTKQYGSEKNEGRNNSVNIEIASSEIPNRLDKVVRNEVKCNEDLFENGDKKKYRMKRVQSFFSTLEWVISNTSKDNTNLLFFNSYKHILHFFEKVQTPESDVYQIQPLESSLENVYQISYTGRDCIVLFLDASQGKQIAKFEESKTAYYELFHLGNPVILITTYASAGNGVNLYYYSDTTKKERRDFSNIHLLDAPFYFFSPINSIDTNQSKNSIIKSNIYYLSKLEKNKIISENEFKIYLNKIRNISDFNSIYLKTGDGLFNRVATYIQAIGRIERTWMNMNNQIVRVDRDVYNDLEDFCKKSDEEKIQYTTQYLKNKPYFSYNISQIFEQIIAKKTDRVLTISDYQEEHLYTQNQKCRDEIKRLVAKLNLIRSNRISEEKATEIIEEWNKLRDIALKQSFSEKENIQLLKKYYCVFETEYYDYKNKSLWFQEKTLNIVPKEANPDSSFIQWEIDKIFRNVLQSPIVRNHFDLKRFEYGFISHKRFFTPYFYQSILAGAIGEEAVKAVFEEEKVRLNSGEIDNSLFELIDLKVAGKPWYIDAKNYSEYTISHYEITDENDALYHPKLNSNTFKTKAKTKFSTINTFHNKDRACKLIYINAFGLNDRPISYFDESFNDVGKDLRSAQIIVIQGMLNKEIQLDNKNYCDDFSHFINELKIILKNG